MPGDKLPIPEFAAKIKAKYPQYRDVDDTVLVQKILAKYPQYSEQVDVSGLKKKDGGNASVSDPQSTSPTNARDLYNKFRSAVPEEFKDENKGGTKQQQYAQAIKNSKPLTAVVPKKKLTPKQVDEQANERLSHPDNAAIFTNEDPVGFVNKVTENKIGEISNDPTNIFNPEAQNEIAINERMQKVAQDNIFDGGASAQHYLDNLQARGADIEHNQTAQIAKQKVEAAKAKYQLLDQMPLEEAAIVAKNPDYKGTPVQFARESNAKAGNDVKEWLNDPDIIDRAKNDPKFAHEYEIAKSNWYSHYPAAAKAEVASKIGQYREDNGGNSWWYNNPGAESTDKIVEEMMQKGLLDSNEALIYKKELQPSLQRSFVGRMLHEQEIPTGGLYNSLAQGIEEGASGFEKSAKDITNKVLLNAPKAEGYFESDENLKNRTAEEDAATARIKLSSGHEILSGIGHLTGFISTLAAGGAVARTAGMESATAEKLAALLAFEGQNAERAAINHPNNSIAQALSTGLSTWVDVSLAHYLPLGKSGKQLTNIFSKDAAPIIEGLTKGSIEKAAASDLLYEKFVNAAKKVGYFTKEVAAGNTKTAAVMTAFNAAHQVIDGVLGDNDLSFAQALKEDLQTFKSAWLSSSLLSVVGAKQLALKTNANIVREAAENPEYYKSVVEKSTKLSDEQKADISKNIDAAAQIVSDLKYMTDMTQAQKDKYMMEHLSAIAKNRQAEGNLVAERKAEIETQEIKPKLDALVKGEDKATEYQNVIKPEEEPLNEKEQAAVDAINEKDLSGTGLKMYADILKDENSTELQKREALKEISQQLTEPENEAQLGEWLGRKATEAIYDLGVEKRQGAEVPEAPLPEAKPITSSKGIIKKAQGIEDLTDAKDIVMQHFVSGGKIHSSVIQSLFGGAGKSVEGEKRDRIGLLSKDGKTVEQLAHQLWEANPKHSTEEYRDAIESVIQDFNSQGAMAKDLVERYINQAVKQELSEAEAKHIDDAIIKKVHESLEGVDEETKNELTLLLRKYQDQYGFVDWERLEKDSNGFSPDILNLSEKTQNKLDEIIRKNLESGQGEPSNFGGQNDSQKENAEGSSGSGNNSPPTSKEPIAEGGSEEDSWTAIRKEKLKEIKGVKEVFERETQKSWSAIQQSALEDVAKRYPEKNLYEATRARTLELAAMYDKGVDYNPTAKDLAVMQEFKRQTEKKISQAEKRLNSENEIERSAALMEVDALNSDLIQAAKASFKREAGTAFGYRQSESKMDANYGLQIRRMELMKAKGGEPLTAEEQKWVNEKWEEEKKLMQEEQALREKGMQEEFDKRIEDLKKQYEQKFKSEQSKPKAQKEKDKTLSQKGKEVADQIRKLKQKGTRVDFTFGTWNLAIEGIAKLVEGGATIAEAIEKLIKDKEIGFRTNKDRIEFENRFIQSLSDQVKKEESLDAIKKLADASGDTAISKEMVEKNLIRDFVDAHVTTHEKGELLDEAAKSLKEILPEVTKEQVAEAYLKQGEFKLPTRKQLEDSLQKQRAEIKKLAKGELTKDQEQAAKLQRAKAQAESEARELERKLKNGEFEEPKKIVLKKADAELIKLEKKRADIEAEFNRRKRAIEEKHKSGLERIADFARSAYVAFLIGGVKTFAKIGAMSIARPFSEAATKLTMGKVFDAVFPNISKAALRGGESSSLRSVKKGMEAYFKQMGAEKMQKEYEKANAAYEEAATMYEEYKASDNPDEKQLKKLENEMNQKLIKATGNIIYQFIGGSSVKDALGAFMNRANEIEHQMGGVEKERFSDGNYLDKINYVLNFIGRSHSALKTFSGRFSFAAGFMARLEGAVREGVDISKSDKILEIAHESYIDWERGKYQQSNFISDIWNNMTSAVNRKLDKYPEAYNKAASALLRSEVAITRVPVNILHEAVVEYTFGVFKSLYMAAKASRTAKDKVKQLGILVNDPEFKQALKEQVQKMDEKQAATIARCFRKGGIGLGLYAFAAITGMVHFGGFHYLGQPKTKDEEDLEENELNPGQVQFGKTKFGEVMSGVIDHVPAFWPMFMGTGMSYMYNRSVAKGKTTNQAAWDALYTHLKIVEGSIPQSKIVQPTVIATAFGNAFKKRTDEYGITDGEDTQGGLPKNATKARDFLKEKNIDVLEPIRSDYSVKKDVKHPTGVMSEKEFEVFKIVRERKINEEILHLMQNARNLKRDELKKKIISIKASATEYAKKQAVKK